jgi:hypothetical protein
MWWDWLHDAYEMAWPIQSLLVRDKLNIRIGCRFHIMD